MFGKTVRIVIPSGVSILYSGLCGPTTSRGSGGMFPQDILRILGVLRCVLVHSEANSSAGMK